MPTARLPLLAASALWLALHAATAAAQAVATTGAIDIGATSDANGSIPSFTVSSPAAASFDVARYGGPDVLTGLSFSALAGNSNVVFSGSTTNIVFGVPVTTAVPGGATVSTSVTLGGTTVSGTSLPLVRGINSSTGTYATGSGSVAAAQLGAFFGSGTVTGSAEGSVTVNKVSPLGGTLTANPGSYTAEVTYTYQTQGHADGAFDPGGLQDTLALSFGNTPGTRPFSIFNGAGLFGLDIRGIGCSGDCSYFDLTGSFENIAGGGFGEGSVAYLGGAPGPVGALFTLWVHDTNDPGVVGFGRLGELERLQITVSAVPEPSAYVMALAGLGILGWQARRRRSPVSRARTA